MGKRGKAAKVVGNRLNKKEIARQLPGKNNIMYGGKQKWKCKAKP